jgi:hypothetical protein
VEQTEVPPGWHLKAEELKSPDWNFLISLLPQ